MPSRAFTLIELLIVVAIIAILAAIAVPNFQEASIRAKTARAKQDLRVLSGALHQYRLDTNQMPTMVVGVGYGSRLNPLTSPVSYLTSVPPDPFYDPENPYYYYVNLSAIADSARVPWDPQLKRSWFIASAAPDRRYNPWVSGSAGMAQLDYDSTNGTVSTGDIFRFDDDLNSMSGPL